MGTYKENGLIDLDKLQESYKHLEHLYLNDGILDIDNALYYAFEGVDDAKKEEAFKLTETLTELVEAAMRLSTQKANEIKKKINIADNLEENRRLVFAKYPNKYKTLEDVELY